MPRPNKPWPRKAEQARQTTLDYTNAVVQLLTDALNEANTQKADENIRDARWYAERAGRTLEQVKVERLTNGSGEAP